MLIKVVLHVSVVLRAYVCYVKYVNPCRHTFPTEVFQRSILPPTRRGVYTFPYTHDNKLVTTKHKKHYANTLRGYDVYNTVFL